MLQEQRTGPAIIPSEKKPQNVYASRLNVLRFLAICSIVWGHSLCGLDEKVFKNSHYQFIQSALIQFGRVGTVNFFLISGFFLSNRLNSFNPLSYLRYRKSSLIIPWVLFLSLFVLIEVVQIAHFKQILHQKIGITMELVFTMYKAFIFHAAYWFIPVSIISSLVLIIFKKYINNLWFGLALAAITLFYSVNLYHGWVPVIHTKAFLAYVFFVWIGVQCKVHLHGLINIINKIPLLAILGALALFFEISCYESIWLNNIGSADAYASIRLSNWILSILIFLVFLKTDIMQWMNYFKPQKYVYGIYLIHCIIIAELMPFINKVKDQQELFYNTPRYVLVHLLFFTGILALAYMIIMLIQKSPLRVMIGFVKRNPA